MYRSASGDEVTRVLVKDLAGAFKGPCTLLAQLFSAPEWHAATDAVRDDGWKLVEMPWQDFLANEDSRALSYRWDNLVKFTSKCKPPGEAETEVKEWTVPVSFLEALRLAGRGPLWVDFLCHLNGPQLPQVILSMGQLYANATVLPLSEIERKLWELNWLNKGNPLISKQIMQHPCILHAHKCSQDT